MNPINALGETGIDVLVCGTGRHRPPEHRLLRTPGRPAVTVVLDRGDEARFTRAVLLSHSRSAGRVVVHPTVPGGHRLLWEDVLQALGPATADRDAPGLPYGTPEHQAAYAAARAQPTCRMTVLRAHLMTTALWADLIHLHRTTPVEVVLVHHAELTDEFRHLLQHCHHRVLGTLTAMRFLHPSAPVGGSGR